MQATDLARIADIITPGTPSPPTTVVEVILLALLFLMFTWLLLFYRRSLHARLFRLRRKRRYCANRDIALQLRDLLRAELSHKHIPADQQYIEQWQAYYSQLQQACFNRTPPDDASLDALFEQSQYWLKHQS